MKPNILFIMTDEQRFDALGANGNPWIKTPHLDQLATQSINLKRHTCSSAICTPARASIMTGMYPRAHRAWHVGYTLPKDTPTIAHWLADAGYATGIFGKSHLEPEMTGIGETLQSGENYYGFQEHALSEDHPQGPYEQWLKTQHPEHYEKLFDMTHEEVRRPPAQYNMEGFLSTLVPSELPAELHQTPWIADQTQNFIKSHHENDDQTPWFAFCSFVDPHHPWNPPKSYLDLYTPDELPTPPRQANDPGDLPIKGYTYPGKLSDEQLRLMVAEYYAMVTQIDDAVGQLYSYLEESDQLENTIIIFTSDHGDFNGDRGMVRKDASLMMSLMQVPMLIRLPGQHNAGHTIHTPTQHEDLAPTLLELVDLPAPEQIQGISFATSLKDKEAENTREFAYFEQLDSLKSDLFENVGIDDGQYKYSRFFKYDRELLVDTHIDPLEYDNLLNRTEYEPQLLRLRSNLKDWLMNCQRTYPPKEMKW